MPMLIELDRLRFIPFALMLVVGLYMAINLAVMEMPLMSYALLAMTLSGTLFTFVLIIRQRTITLTDFVLLVFIAVVMVASFVYDTDWKEWIYVSFTICFLRFMFNFYRNNLLPLLVGLTIGFTIGVFAQLHQLLTHPELWVITDDKEVTGYLLGGNYNQMGICLLAALLLTMLCTKISRKFFILFIPTALACIVIPLIVGSMTAVTSIILFLLLCIVPSSRLRRISVTVLLVSVLLFQLFVCFNGKGIEDNDLLVWFIEDVLGKDITFTNRTHMWDSALRAIVDSPLIGYGYPDADWYRSNLTSFAIGPHNVMLGVLIYGGVIAFIIYIYLLFNSFIQSFRIRDYWADVILIGMAVLCLMMLMEVYSVSIIFTFFTLAEYYPQLHNQIASRHEQ